MLLILVPNSGLLCIIACPFHLIKSNFQTHQPNQTMKSILSFLITLAITSSVNAEACFRYCWFTSPDFDSFSNCLANCNSGSRRTNEIKDTQTSSLRGLSTFSEEGANQNADFTQDGGQCGLVYNYCSTSADCCGDMDCVDFGKNGYSITLCYDNVSSFFGDDDKF